MADRKVGSNTAPKAAGNRGKGRPKGAVNKTTASVKAALSDAFEKLGGVKSLVEWGTKPENRGEFYKLWAKMLPQEVTGADGQAIQAVVVLPSLDRTNE